MLQRADATLPQVFVHCCVTVKASEFDDGSGNPANVIGVVMEIDTEYQKYKIGTKAGIIKTRLERNAFDLVGYRGLKTADIR